MTKYGPFLKVGKEVRIPMDRRIRRLVDLHFEDIPYSEEIMKAQKAIETALEEEYQKEAAEASEAVAFERIVKAYPTLTDMALLAGYSAENVETWRTAGRAKERKPLKKEFFRQRRRIYLLSFLWMCAGVYLVDAPLLQTFYPLLVAAMTGLLAYFLHMRYRKKEEALTADAQYDTDAYLFLRAQAEKYTKRSLNGVALLFAVTAIFLSIESRYFYFANPKMAEFLQYVSSHLFILEVPVYLCIKNLLCVQMLQRRIHLPDRETYKKHLLGVTVGAAVYWLAALTPALLLQSQYRDPVNKVLFAGVLFALLLWLYDLLFRKKLTARNFVLNKKRIAVFSAAALCLWGYTALQRDTWYMQPYINATPVVPHSEHGIAYGEETGIYTITSSTDDFKILHLTDIHLGGSLYSYRKDIKALEAVYAEIEYTRPDLVIVTGDLTFPLGIMSLSLNNSAPVNQFAAFMRNIDIPWAFTYGNHDTDGLANFSKSDLNELCKQLSYKTSGNFLYPYIQPEITGRNNQLIEIRNRDGSLNQAIFLLDSNAYTNEGINAYDYIHDDQVDWYASHVERLNAEEGHTVSSMVFFHIPLQQYRTAYELYEQGSDEVEYFFGENGEQMIDKVCCSDYPSNLFDTMLALDSTKAVFCGHDHYNNMSLAYKGIRLTYGMSIDYLAMPGIENDTAQRGAELITLHADSSWEIEQIPLSSITDP